MRAKFVRMTIALIKKKSNRYDIAGSGPDWANHGKIGQNWSKLVKNGQKCAKFCRKVQKSAKIASGEPFVGAWPVSGQWECSDCRPQRPRDSELRQFCTLAGWGRVAAVVAAVVVRSRGDLTPAAHLTSLRRVDLHP